MTSAQRYWLSSVLLVFALFLAVYHLEWTGLTYDDENQRRLVLPLYDTSSVSVEDVKAEIAQRAAKQGLSVEQMAHQNVVTDPELQRKLEGRIKRHGIYVRFSHGIAQGLFFGALLPLLLIGVCGFIAFGRPRAVR
jgi:hypothetical protein